MRVVRYEAGRIIPAEGKEMVHLGWVYFNPDSGLEWSNDHPIRSGQVPDAERVKRATSNEHCFAQALAEASERVFAMSDQLRKLKSALRPFAKIADTSTVQAAAHRGVMLTLSNGERMCGMEASDFINARAALAAAEEGE